MPIFGHNNLNLFTMTRSTNRFLRDEKHKAERQLNRLEAMQNHLLQNYVLTSTIHSAVYLNKRIIKLEIRLNKLRWRIGRVA